MIKIQWKNRSKHLCASVVFCVLFAFILIALLSPFEASKPETPSPPLAQVIHAIRAKYGAFSPEITLYGTVESKQETTLKAAITTNILETPIDIGECFKKGDLLLKLDSEDVQLRLKTVQSDINILKKRIEYSTHRMKRFHTIDILAQETSKLTRKAYDRHRALRKQNFVSTATLERQETELKAALSNAVSAHSNYVNEKHARMLLQLELKREKTKKKSIERDLERTRIISPFEGCLIKRFVSIGDHVQPGQMLLEIYESKSLRIRAQLPTQYVTSLRKQINQNHRIVATGLFHQQRFTTQLTRLNHAIESHHAGVDAFFRLESNQPVDKKSHSSLLPIGLTLQLHLKLPKQPHLLSVPLEAVYQYKRIYKISNNHLVSIPVTVLGEHRTEKNAHHLLIQSTVKEGTPLLSNHLPHAIDGLWVTIAP